MSKQVDAGLQLFFPLYDPKHPKPNPGARLRHFPHVECGATLQPIRQSVRCLRMRLGKGWNFNWKQFAASRATTVEINSLTSSFVCSIKAVAHVRSSADAPNSARGAAALLTTAFLFQPTPSHIALY